MARGKKRKTDNGKIDEKISSKQQVSVAMNDLKRKQGTEKSVKGSRTYSPKKASTRKMTVQSHEVEMQSESDNERNEIFQSKSAHKAVFGEGDKVVEMEVQGTEFQSEGELSEDDSEGEEANREMEEASVQESTSQIVSEDDEAQSSRSRSSVCGKGKH